MSKSKQPELTTTNESIRVVIRCRPMNSNEQAQGHSSVVETSERGEIFVQKPFVQEPPKQFTFDACYGSNSEQAQIYDNTASFIVSNVLEGYNGTIFAYGQTGTGKTHTMSGIETDEKEKGLMPRSFEGIFKAITGDSDQTQFLVRASYLEIYNEEIRDLLAKNPRHRLELHEKPESGVYVKDLSYYAAKTPDELREVMNIGSKNRSVGETAMNARSSRSHSLFQITVERSEVGADGKQHIRVGKLNLVDLAGSERQSKTQAKGDRLKEATKINLSLSSLCHVISALTDPKATHIPYRDSKLTRLLQDSLGGNTKTVMIANVGPADYNYEETMNSLRYASRAKAIQNKPRINEDPKDALLREYQEELTKLREQLAALAEGADPSQVLAGQAGVLGALSTGQKPGRVIEVEDKEKMKAFEDKLEREKVELRQKAESDRALIENQANLQQEEKDKLLQELRAREEGEQKTKSKQQKMLKKLKKMEEKITTGNQAIEVAKAQKKELKRTKEQLQKEVQQQAELQIKLQEQEEEYEQQMEKFSSVAEDLEFKNNKLNKLWEKYELSLNELNQISDDFDRERNDMYDTIYELTNQLKLKNMIIEYFIPPEEYRKYEKLADWNEEINDWQINNPIHFRDLKSGSKRPQSAVGMKRPTSEYSRIAKGLGDLNPRYKFENILMLDLDMPERTTEDYQGVPSAKVQQAIQAILNDNDIQNDNIPLSTLINFDDSCLQDDVPVDDQVPSNRPKSGKRPKSAKKKKVVTEVI